jgi:hypothetical protein
MNRHERRAAAARARRARHNGHGVERAAYTIDEFSWAHGFSRATYYNLKAKGLGPDETRVLNRVTITEESARRWRRRHTKPPPRPVVDHHENHEPITDPRKASGAKLVPAPLTDRGSGSPQIPCVRDPKAAATTGGPT